MKRRKCEACITRTFGAVRLIIVLSIVCIRDSCATLDFHFHPRSANFDFEIAAINAFRSTFPSVATYACRFHFGQALWRNIQHLGLTDDYESRSEVGHWLHLFYTICHFCNRMMFLMHLLLI